MARCPQFEQNGPFIGAAQFKHVERHDASGLSGEVRVNDCDSPAFVGNAHSPTAKSSTRFAGTRSLRSG
jgi:hypothetical protein